MTAAYRIASVLLVASFPFVHATALTGQTGSVRVTVPSPTAASLGKFGDVPVNLYTGVPDISIPLFTVKGRTLELPITLRYHAAGIRVEEIGGWAGLGWALEAGGTITRTVRGLVDEGNGGYYHTGHAFYNSLNWPYPSPTTIQSIVNRSLDGEPDRFFFSFAGRSGQFVMGPTTTSGTKEYRSIPHQKLRFVPTFGTGGITSWQITTEDGTRYTFAMAETTTDYSTSSNPSETASNYGESHISSWHLTGMRSVGGDSITLYYNTYPVRHRQGSYREMFHHITGNDGESCVPNEFAVTSEYQILVQRLDSIKAAAHTVRFTATLRSDARSPTNVQQEYRIERITVTTPAGKQLRRFQFDHDYFQGNRLRLKSVQEQDSTGASLPPNTFTYDGQTLPARTSNALDHWGYYNGKTSNPHPVPIVVSPAGGLLAGADRRPEPAFMKAGILTRITYPTGGYNEFVYESNDYGRVGTSDALPIDDGVLKSAQQSSSGGQGLRTAQFTVAGTHTATAKLVVLLDPSGCSGGDWPPCPWVELVGKGSYPAGTHYVLLAPGTYTLRASDEGTLDGLASIAVEWRDRAATKKKTAGGLRVAELRTADAVGTITTRRYKYTLQSDTTRSSGLINAEPAYSYSYNSPQCGFFSRSSMSKMPLGEGPPVGYAEVMVWHGANAEHGKTRHAFRSVRDAPDEPPPFGWPYSPRTSHEWKRGQQKGTTEYNVAGQVQRRTASTHRFREAVGDSATTRKFPAMSINAYSAGQVGTNYQYHPFEIISAWAHPEADTTFIHNETGGSAFSTVKTYTYGNPVHMQPTVVTEIQSDDMQRVTRMKYPADYANGSGNAEATAITAMKGNAHLHSQVIERWVYEGGGSVDQVVSAELTSFRANGGRYLPYQRFILNAAGAVSDFTPSAVSGSFTKDSRYLLHETANTYDAFGRVLQLADARGKVTDYVYGGNPNNAFLTKVTRVKDTTGPINLVTDLAYDTNGNLASIKDEAGTFRYFTYDAFGRLRQIRNHGNAVLKGYGYTYSRTSGNGWTFQPNSPNLVLDTTYLQHSPSVARVVSREYLDGLGRPIQSSVQDGSSYHVTAQQYDAVGREWRAWKPYTRTSASYDASFSANATSFYNTYLSGQQREAIRRDAVHGRCPQPA